MERSALILCLLFLCVTSFVASIFFGVLLVNQASIFYLDLVNLTNRIETLQQIEIWNSVLHEYRMAWYVPNLLGLVFGLVTLISGALSFWLIGRETNG